MYSHNHSPYVDHNYTRRGIDTQHHHMTKQYNETSFKNVAIPISPSSPYHYPSSPSVPSTPNFYSPHRTPSSLSIPPSPSSPSQWNYRMTYPIPSPASHYPPTPTSSHVPISPMSSPVVNNSVAFLEDILSKEHTICLQVRSLSTTIAKLTKDVLATGKACPSSFVNVLKDQVAKMQNLLATLNLIEQNKRSFPVDFVKEVTLQWHQRVAKQRGNRKRKGSEPSFEEFKIESPTTSPVKENKSRKMFVVIPSKQAIKTEPHTPKEFMNISNIIN